MKSVALFLIVLMLWTVGLLAFAARVDKSTPAEEPETAQAIVALTGNATMRITTGVKLLELNKGKRLLVSGVNPEVRPAELQAVSKATRGVYDCCIDLGFKATDTKGNASEIAGWAEAHDYSRLIVVTADYHMPRAILELRGAMPNAELTPYPIRTAELDSAHWWRTGRSARRMILEYSKYLAVLAREAFLKLGPSDRAAANTGEPAR
ncbi:MAG: hypothetical protein JWO33_240 [Caulobacteraceae bacterium]|nr:hypothetical protein [Caulobacteraceae bacterium]